MKAFVTGAAGFIGSNLVDRLLAAGHQVTGFDNLSTGFRRFLEGALANSRFRLVEGDLTDATAVTDAMAGADFVFHLAANRDLPSYPEHPRRDLEQNTIVTWNVLEAMRATGARRIAFASTASVYGEPPIVPTPEDAPFPVQTSVYGASKVAAEGMINAYVTAFGFQAYIFRFGPVMGERCTHGSVVDFYRQLIAHPERLDLPADGRQWESCLYVQDLIDAILLATERCTLALNVFNLGTDENCQVNDSSGADGGPFLLLDCARMRSLGWKPRLAIAEGVNRTLEFLRENPWLLEARR